MATANSKPSISGAKPGTKQASVDREKIVEKPNLLGLEGVDFIEYATSKPQVLGQVLETMGFRPGRAAV